MPVISSTIPSRMPAGVLTGSARLICAGVLSMLASLAAAAQDNGAHRIERDGLKLETAALEPDQVRAFFLGRGFSAEDAEHLVATGCVFRSSIANAGTTPDAPHVVISLAQWRVTPEGGAAKPPLVREDWATTWAARGVAEDAAVAFHWALFPTEQTLAASDYNWGMLTLGQPAGTRLALDVTWRTGDTTHKQRLENLRCGK